MEKFLEKTSVLVKIIQRFETVLAFGNSKFVSLGKKKWDLLLKKLIN
jgi:hypothetical protein